MRDEDGIHQINVIIDRTLVFLDRPEVGEQLLILVGILIVSRGISWTGWRLVDNLRRRRLRKRTGDGEATLPLDRIPVRLLRSVTAPVIGTGLALAAQQQLAAAGRVTGLLSELISVFVVLFVGELVMAMLIVPLDPHEATRYRRRFFKPLMWIVVGLMVLDHITDLGTLASAPVFDLFGSPISMGALFWATLGIWFWTDAINLLNTVVVSFVVKHTSLNDGSAEATMMLIRYALILMGITYGISQLQLSAATVAAITGGLSVGIGFGLREILSNFISGTFILFERSLRPGDIVEVDGQMGTVERLSVRSTTVRTLDNEEIVVPNAAFFTDKFKSFTGTDEKVRFNVVVLANCLNDPERVRTILQETAAAHPEVLDDPAPEAWVEDQFGNNVVSYRLHMWSSSPLDVPRLRSDVVRAVWAAFHAAGIQLVFPDLELHFNDTALRHLPAGDTAAFHQRETSDLSWQSGEPAWASDDVEVFDPTPAPVRRRRHRPAPQPIGSP